MTLELKKALTGKVRKRVEYNMITNFYKDYIETQLAMWSSPFLNNRYFQQISNVTPHSLVGGVMLFDSHITESVNNYAPKEGNCIGHAGGDYAGTNPYRGDYVADTNFSGPILGPPQGYRRVWEFERAKANGVIRSVCLCHLNGGNQGFKNDALDTSANVSPVFGQISIDTMPSMSKFLKVSADYKTVYYQAGGVTNGVVSLKKLITPDFSSIGYYGTCMMKADTATAPSITVPINNYLWFEFCGDVLYGLWFNNNTKAITLKKYDLNLNEISSITLQNPNNKSLKTNTSYNFGIIGNTIYALDSSDYTALHKWDISTGAYTFGGALPGIMAYLCTFDDNNIAIIDGSSAIYLYNGNTYMGPIYEGSYIAAYRRLQNKPIVYLHATTSPNQIYSALMGNAFYTINNLTEDIEKSSGDTLTVTYDILFPS